MSVFMGTSLMAYFRATDMDVRLLWGLQLGFDTTQALNTILLLAFLYSVGGARRPPWRWLGLRLVRLVRLVQVALWLGHPTGKAAEWPRQPLLLVAFLLPWADMLRVLSRALRQRRPGIGLVALGVVATILRQVFHVGNGGDNPAAVLVPARVNDGGGSAGAHPAGATGGYRSP